MLSFLVSILTSAGLYNIAVLLWRIVISVTLTQTLHWVGCNMDVRDVQWKSTVNTTWLIEYSLYYKCFVSTYFCPTLSRQLINKYPTFPSCVLLSSWPSFHLLSVIYSEVFAWVDKMLAHVKSSSCQLSQTRRNTSFQGQMASKFNDPTNVLIYLFE